MKIIFKTKKFVVNEKAVVCIIDTSLDYFDFYGDTVEGSVIQNVSNKRFEMNNQRPAMQTLHFKGVAKCKESDTFDEKTGRNIAEKRAMIKVYNYYKKFFKDCCNRLEKNLDKFNTFQRDLANKENYLETELTSKLMEV